MNRNAFGFVLGTTTTTELLKLVARIKHLFWHFFFFIFNQKKSHCLLLNIDCGATNHLHEFNDVQCLLQYANIRSFDNKFSILCNDGLYRMVRKKKRQTFYRYNIELLNHPN